MLVLTRREGERIRIGDDVYVCVVRCGSQVVRIGIDAPRNVAVVREELIDPEEHQEQPAA